SWIVPNELRVTSQPIVRDGLCSAERRSEFVDGRNAREAGRGDSRGKTKNRGEAERGAKMNKPVLLLAVVGSMACGCSNMIGSTGTTIGWKAMPGDGSTQAPQVTFGYKRMELAFVPTDQSTAQRPEAGSTDGEDTDAFS